MAFTPIHLSGIAFTTGGSAGTLSDSTVTFSSALTEYGDFTFFLPPDTYQVRVTMLSFDGTGDPTTQGYQYVDSTFSFASNESIDPAIFVPTVYTRQLSPHFETPEDDVFITFSSGIASSADATFLVEIDADGGGEEPAGECFWSHDSMVGVTEDCVP